jgi:drug/metabolite transporter (DMT)-like permease
MKNLVYVLLSIGLVAISWGSYGPLLTKGGIAMGGSHWLPFIFVGVAYFLIAVLASWALLAWLGEPGAWTATGIIWSFLAGAVTAVGALGVILALTNGGSPIFVMPLVFGGAPVVNTVVSMWMSKTHKEAGPMFYAGMILVIAGAVAVLWFNPAVPAPRPGAPVDVSFFDRLKVLLFVALTAVCWGCYGPLLHKGQMAMQNSRLRPFICVGAAYVVVAIAVPLILRAVTNEGGELTFSGASWSLAGGVAGALGSLGVILAFTFGGKPIYVMPLVFGFAPVVNTFISIATAKDLNQISPFFYAGLIIVVAGAVSVLIFAPRGKPHAAATPVPAPTPEPAKG